ncbi:MAG TPA: PilC/PilY family type IV pilus protein [Desulfobacterales bacterium]
MSEKSLKRIWSPWMPAVIIAVVILQAAAIPQAAISRLYLNGSDDTSATVTITSGSNRMLIVCLDAEGTTGINSVRIDGRDLTKVAEMVETAGAGNATSMWVMLDTDLPAAGTYSFTVDAGTTAPSLAVMLWEGLAQQVPSGAAVNMTGVGVLANSISTSVAPPAAGSLVLGTTGHGDENCSQFATPSGWTRQWSITPASAFHAGDSMISPDTNTVTLTETTSTSCNYNRAAQVVAAFAPAAVASGQYAYKKKITVDAAKVDGSCGSSLSDYPMLVKIDNDADLRDHVQSSQGYDIVFQDGSGIQLYHEIEKYDALTGSLVAWVRVPTLSASSATEIWMYYGDGAITSPTGQPAAVWSSGHAGVWHLNQTPAGFSGEIKDSTANANHGRAVNMETGDLDPAMFASGLDFDGTNELIEIPDHPALTTSGQITFEAWVKLDNAGRDSELFRKRDEDGPIWASYRIIMDSNGSSIRPAIQWINTSNNWHWVGGNYGDITAGNWYHVAGTHDGGSTLRLYLNGNQISSRSDAGGTMYDTDGPLAIGSTYSDNWDSPDGIMDEVRVSNVARSSCWLKTEYNNLSAPGSFYSVGTEQTAIAGHSIISSTNGFGTITPNGEKIVPDGGSQTYVITADYGYMINEVLVDGYSETVTNNEYTFTNVTGDHTIYVNFLPIQGDFNWSEGSFNYRRALTIDHTKVKSGCQANLYHYPLLVSIANDSQLKSVSNGGHVANDSGYDIIFKQVDGTPLSHEVEVYDPAAGTLVAWVRIPSLPTDTDTTIYMYYGNSEISTPTADSDWVWTGSYAGVWHLNQAPTNASAGVRDSSNNGNHGQTHNMETSDLISGKIGPALHFTASDENVLVPDHGSLDLTGDITLSAWVNFDSTPTAFNGIVSKKGPSGANAYGMFMGQPDDPKVRIGGGTYTATASPYINLGTWHFMTAVFDNANNQIRYYWNGTQLGNAVACSDSPPSNGSELEFGSEGGNDPLDGRLDEVRVSSIARNACWIETEYNNQNSPATFYGLGSEEINGNVFTITATKGTDGAVSPLGDVTVSEGSSKTYTFTPDYGFRVDEVFVDGSAVTISNNQYTFANVLADHTIHVTFTPSEGDYSSPDGTFLYRKPITILSSQMGASCASDLYGFPVLIRILNDNSLKHDTQGGHVQHTEGYDIIFKDASDVLLFHELEYYDGASGSLYAWVRIPTLPTDTDFTIYVYYGNADVSVSTENPDGVWDATFAGVWHLDESPPDWNAGHTDASGNANHATPKNLNDGGGGTTDAAGKILGADFFKGDDDWVEAPTSSSLDIVGNELTLSAWVKSAVDQNDDCGIVIKSDGSNYNYQLGLQGSDQANFRVKTSTKTTYLTGGTVLNQDQWYFIYGIYDGTTARVFVNGSQDGSDNNSGNLVSSGAAPLVMGRRAIGDNRFFEGIIDEVRVSNVARSTCWMQTEYSNQNNPGAFIAVGAEQSERPTYTITATAGSDGVISPSGISVVTEGGSKSYVIVANEGYEVDTLTIDGTAVTPATSYSFTNVVADHTITVSFREKVDLGGEYEELPPGCASNLTYEYSTGFNTDDLTLLNLQLDTNSHIKLNTGNAAIDPDKIVIPFRQKVAVTFLYEGAGFKYSDFGWMYAAEDIDGTRRPVYDNVNDNNKNGVLDVGPSNTSDRFGDTNGDGVVNARDNRILLNNGNPFEAGTELVFYLEIEEDDNNWLGGDLFTTFFTKTAWNTDVYDADGGECVPSLGSFTKTFYLGRAITEGSCKLSSNWMDADAVTRADNVFGLTFGYDDTQTMDITYGEKFPHVVVGAPSNKPNEWVLGWEDLPGGGDTDHNDLVFIIERETGGTVQLNADKAISSPDENANISGVTIGVYDYIPCAGMTDIEYELSIDGGTNWVPIDAWDEVYEFTLGADNRKFIDQEVLNWSPGSPAYTYRTRRVDFTGLALTGNELIWRATMKSREEGCEPKLIDLNLDISVNTHGFISRSAPVILGNVMYAGNMETPDVGWATDEMRGHLFATRIYDPTDPDQTSALDLWDAGAVLQTKAPSDRTIYIPDISVVSISNEVIGHGDGFTKTFSGTLGYFPISATTVRITDTIEIFADERTDVLDGDMGGTGKINRFTGDFEINFATAPGDGVPIKASYQYYQTSATLRNFTAAGVTNAELGLTNATVEPSGYVYDLNGDGSYTAADGDWLVNWVRGYADGAGIKKEWLLGPIDHSMPAVATPPNRPSWFYGTAVNEAERTSYEYFMDSNATRKTVIYVGALDGMLHAFDAGRFRHGDNLGTAGIEENRGYFYWPSTWATCPSYCSATQCSTGACPDYGTGEELWAFIPANLVPRLKNNAMSLSDKAYVDASPAIADVYINGSWHTVLLSAEGIGGDTIFCLDITDPDNPSFLWEFADPDLFRSRSSPSVGQVGRLYQNGTTKWVAFFVSGKTYEDTLYPSIYIIDIADGSVVERIFLDADTAGMGGVLSGQPAIVDSDANGYIDRLYIGSDKGLMYKVNLPDDPDSLDYGINHCVINRDTTDSLGSVVDPNWVMQPIYGSPTVVVDNDLNADGTIDYDIRIFFGTGDSPYYDEDINTADVRYHFYAFKDKAGKGICDENKVYLDWFYQLPEGHRVYASAFAAAGKIYFGTSTAETEDPCASSNDPNVTSGKLFAFDMDQSYNLEATPLFEQEVGDIVVSPIVEDRHLFVNSKDSGLQAFGSGKFNNQVLKGGNPQVFVRFWREMY